ncbi:MAG: hypothetical protein KJO49_13645, partial [Bacteroidia bacterium]|nr:hypothetical protein [Bacteroidia bacterium]
RIREPVGLWSANRVYAGKLHNHQPDMSTVADGLKFVIVTSPEAGSTIRILACPNERLAISIKFRNNRAVHEV